jgi:hypothetical protein
MDEKKKLKINGKPITGDYIRRLYESEKGSAIKQARMLSRKVVYPNNFEKMNVKRALILFSPKVSGSIDFQRLQNNPDYKDSEETTKMMGLCRRWFEVIQIF